MHHHYHFPFPFSLDIDISQFLANLIFTAYFVLLGDILLLLSQEMTINYISLYKLLSFLGLLFAQFFCLLCFLYIFYIYFFYILYIYFLMRLSNPCLSRESISVISFSYFDASKYKKEIPKILVASKFLMLFG